MKELTGQFEDPDYARIWILNAVICRFNGVALNRNLTRAGDIDEKKLL